MENTSTTDYDNDIFGRHFYLTWIQIVPLVILTCVTFVANGAILVMFVLTKSLRRCRNIYIASLALADFLIGCTMPVSMLETVKIHWSPAGAWCKVHLIAKYSLLYVSLLSILLISFDRWWSINFPFLYRVRQSRTIAICAVTVSWGLSFALHIPPIVIMSDVPQELNASSTEKRICEAPYRKHFMYLPVSSVIEYLCPLVTLWILNCSIYFRISRRKNIKIRRSMSVTESLFHRHRKSSSESEGNNNGSDESSDPCTQIPNERRSSVIYKSARRHSLANCVNSKHQVMFQRHTNRRLSFDVSATSNPFNIRPPISHRELVNSMAGKHSVRKQSDELVRDMMVKQDKKAARSLGVIVVVLTFCLTPHMVAELINSVCGQCLPPILMTVTFWVLVANSVINPFLYGLLNAEFRKVLKQWLYCNSTSRKYKIKEAIMYWNIMPMNTDMPPDNELTFINVLRDWPS